MNKRIIGEIMFAMPFLFALLFIFYLIISAVGLLMFSIVGGIIIFIVIWFVIALKLMGR